MKTQISIGVIRGRGLGWWVLGWWVLSWMVLSIGCSLDSTHPEESSREDPSPDVTSTPDLAPVDVRPAFQPVPAFGIQIAGPTTVVDAREEKLFCYFYTYPGPDVGVAELHTQQSLYSHHIVVLRSRSDDYPDGQLIEGCGMEDGSPLIMESMQFMFPAPQTEDIQHTVLPEGMAVKLPQNTRLMIQSHYLNYSSQPILVQDAITLRFLKTDEVTTWAASLGSVYRDISLDAGVSTTSIVTCPIAHPYHLLFLAGHMHWYGTSLTISLGSRGRAEAIYTVPRWNSSYMDNPPVNQYEPGELALKPGDVLTTTCNWFNSTDERITFPTEMCMSYGLLYPSEHPVNCED